jgi:hypothetical protein
LSRLNKFILDHASGGKVLLLLAIAISSFVLMAAVFAPAFQDETGGLRPFDLNFGVSAEVVYRELPAYTDRSRTIYLGFALADYVYPAAAASFFTLLWAWMFRKRPHHLFARLTDAGILLFPFLFALVDWLENAGFLWVIFSYPVEYPRIATLAGTLKGVKPFIEAVILVLTLVFAVIAIRASRSSAAMRTRQ